MDTINNWCGTGNAVADANIRHSQDGQYVFADFTIAVRRRWKGKDETEYKSDFIPIKAGGGAAKFAEKFVKKGVKFEVEGAVEQEEWTDKETGKKRTRLIVSASNISFAESRKSSQGSQSDPPQTSKADDGFVYVPETSNTELPFA